MRLLRVSVFITRWQALSHWETKNISPSTTTYSVVREISHIFRSRDMPIRETSIRKKFRLAACPPMGIVFPNEPPAAHGNDRHASDCFPYHWKRFSRNAAQLPAACRLIFLRCTDGERLARLGDPARRLGADLSRARTDRRKRGIPISGCHRHDDPCVCGHVFSSAKDFPVRDSALCCSVLLLLRSPFISSLAAQHGSAARFIRKIPRVLLQSLWTGPVGSPIPSWVFLRNTDLREPPLHNGFSFRLASRSRMCGSQRHRCPPDNPCGNPPPPLLSKRFQPIHRQSCQHSISHPHPSTNRLPPNGKSSSYTQMVRIRRFEQASMKQYAADKMGGFLHLYIGQESVAVGNALALR